MLFHTIFRELLVQNIKELIFSNLSHVMFYYVLLIITHVAMGRLCVRLLTLLRR